MQAIVTKYLGPTNSHGARVKAKCQRGAVVISWDDNLDIDGNHDNAARALRERFDWPESIYGRLIRGGMPDGTGNVYVFAGTGKGEV